MPDGTSTDPIGVVVVNYGSHELVARNLASIDAAAGVRVVVVDNPTEAAERDAVRRLGAERGWTVVEPDRNLGFGGGVARGIDELAASGVDVFVLLNPDASIDRPGLRELARAVRQDPLLLAAPTIVRADGSRWFDGARVLRSEGWTTTRPGSDSSAADGWLTGACLALSAELWRRSGGFDDSYFLYWEDVDFSWRCVAVGGRLAVLPGVRVIHSVGGTQRPGGKSTAYVYYNCRNRLIFARRHLSADEQRLWRRRSVAYAKRVVLRGGRRDLVTRGLPLAWAALRGTLAGLRGGATGAGATAALS